MDLNTFDVSLGINVNALQYLNEQPIRMMSKSQSTGRVFFVIEFNLIKDPCHSSGGTITEGDT
jgi:hypothetical protein